MEACMVRTICGVRVKGFGRTQANAAASLRPTSLAVHDNVEKQMVDSQTLKDVKELVRLLPEKQREVVLMRFYQDLSFKEIAELTGVSINTALGRMRYAIMNMRRMAQENNVSLVG